MLLAKPVHSRGLWTEWFSPDPGKSKGILRFGRVKTTPPNRKKYSHCKKIFFITSSCSRENAGSPSVSLVSAKIVRLTGCVNELLYKKILPPEAGTNHVAKVFSTMFFFLTVFPCNQVRRREKLGRLDAPPKTQDPLGFSRFRRITFDPQRGRSTTL